MTSVSIFFLLQSTNYGSSDHVNTVLDPTPDLHPTTQPTNAHDNPDAYVEKLMHHWVKGASCAQQYLDSVINAYFSKFPWRLKVSENPTAPASEQLNSIENLLKVEMEQKQCKVTAMHKLSGIGKKKPKALQAHQWWSKDHFDTIVRPSFQERCNAQGIKGKAMVTFQEQVT
ncbi:hypothetical protein F5J12DRAFT_785052 [Pisolithus orientalis]|uniref:uncharacterized protein n=1 Tax=Pisolithus orientalis TaxID=936130 RepID=UPI0022254549|nr:uncharacterized protein F5J12DRAFT_785052 [Pisolithus orientalis]KAI5997835.1 hypothetical protein F5J12DRAFT_785052 [Pisolithus orientalis]